MNKTMYTATSSNENKDYVLSATPSGVRYVESTSTRDVEPDDYSDSRWGNDPEIPCEETPNEVPSYLYNYDIDDAELIRRDFAADVDKHLCALISGKGKLNDTEILEAMNTAINIAKLRMHLNEMSSTVDGYIKAFEDKLYEYNV
jgi:hypothetical protein